MTTSPVPSRIWPWAAAVVAAVVTAGVLRSLNPSAPDQLRAENEQLRQQNAALQEALARTADGAPESGAAAVSTVVPGRAETRQPAGTDVSGSAEIVETVPVPADSGKAVQELVPTPTGEAPAPKSDGLALAGTHAAPIDGGMRATMRFAARTSEPLGIVAVVVRLPRDSDGRILDFAPADASAFTGVAKRISEDGKFAVFQGTAAVVESLEFALSVSGPATAEVRGTCGVGPFELKIVPGGTSVRNL